MDILKDWDLIIRFKKHFLFHTLYYQAKRAPVWEQSLAKDLRRSLKGFRSDSGGKRLAVWVKKTMQSIPAGRKYWLLYCFSIYSLSSFFSWFCSFFCFYDWRACLCSLSCPTSAIFSHIRFYSCSFLTFPFTPSQVLHSFYLLLVTLALIMFNSLVCK